MSSAFSANSDRKVKSRREFVRMGAIAGSLVFLPGMTGCRNRSQGSTPEEAGNQSPLIEMGLLDVTKFPYLADPEGKDDSTKAIQQAVNDARDNYLVCYFPEGTYLISDTISCEQQVEKLEKPLNLHSGTQHYWPFNQTPLVLMGSTKGRRPVIKLSKDATGFDDPLKPKLAVRLWAQTYYDAPGTEEPVWGQEQGSINFNNYFIGIDIDIRGHAGAIGLRHSGSQGSSLLNSTIYADGAYSGMSNCCGQGGGTYNIEVIGGEHGIVIDSDSRFPILTSCIFRSQTKDVISFTGNTAMAQKYPPVPTMLIGCQIKPESNVAVDMSIPGSGAGLLIIDSVIELQNGGNIVLSKNKENIFIENSYIRSVASVCSNGEAIPASGRWTLIEQFSSGAEQGVNLINGVESNKVVSSYKQVSSSPSYEKIHKRHYSGIPSFEDGDAVNVRSFGAKGDGTTNDTEAFRKAIAASNKVFVPKGNFLLTGTLELGPDTHIFGLTRSFTSIGSGDFRKRKFMMVDYDFPPDPIKHEPFLLKTVDDVNAAPGLTFLSVKGDMEWKSGKGTWMLASGSPEYSGNTGGKFYGGGMGKGRILKGITQPASFYALNVERALTNPQSEIKNCSHIRIYYFKVEAGTEQQGHSGAGRDANTPCRISDSSDIRIYCLYGNVKNLGDKPMLDVVNSDKVLVCQLKAFYPGTFPHLREERGDKIVEMPSARICSLYERY